MHQISQKSIDLAKKHAFQLQEHGVCLVKIGESLSKKEHLEIAPQESDFLIRVGQQLQVYAQEMMSLSEIAEGDSIRSTDAYTAAVKTHADATKLEIAASKIVQALAAKATNRRLPQMQNRSNH